MRTEVLFSKNAPKNLERNIQDELVILSNLPPLDDRAVVRQIKVGVNGLKIRKIYGIEGRVYFNIHDFDGEGNYLRSKLLSRKDVYSNQVREAECCPK